MSLEYTMFRYSDEYPTSECLSQMIMQVCMDDQIGGGDWAERLIRCLVNAAYELRYQEALAESDEDEVDIPCVREPGRLFMDCYAKSCRAMREPFDEDDVWWEDWWPTDCLWHPDDIAHLARLKAGETASVRRQLRAEFSKHKENADA